MSPTAPSPVPSPREPFSGFDRKLAPLVLVVDDSRMQRKIVTSALKKWGYRIMEAEGGEEALAICKNHDVNMVISDWIMPGMDGPEFCAAFRGLDRSEYGYFVLLTSKAETSEVAHGLDAGADDFLTKPVSFGELRARLRAGERIMRMQSELLEKNEIVSDTLERLQVLHDSLNRDLDEARKLQQSLVKDSVVQVKNGTVAMVLQPCGHVGGDLVGQFAISDTKIGLFSLDVSGHGVTSALMTARLAGYLSGGSRDQNVAMQKTDEGFEPRDPAETARILNDILLSELDTENYFTMALAILDLTTGEMQCVQAGHPHPLIQRRGGQVDSLGNGGIPIGLIPGAEFSSFTAKLEPGDRLFLYSDGLTECENQANQFLDEDGLIEILQVHREAKAPELLNDLTWELQRFNGEGDFADDVSALVFDFHVDQPSS